MDPAPHASPLPSRPPRRIGRGSLALGGATLLLAGAGAGSLYQIHVRHRLGTVSPGRVYKSGVMPRAQLQRVARDLGLRSVIDLRTSIQGQDSTNTTEQQAIDAEDANLAAIGVKHIHLPTAQVPSDATVDRFLQVMAEPSNLPTLIHCYHGIGRTELFVAIYRIEFEGWPREKARAATRLLLAGSSFSDSAEKGRYLISYRNRRP